MKNIKLTLINNNFFIKFIFTVNKGLINFLVIRAKLTNFGGNHGLSLPNEDIRQ